MLKIEPYVEHGDQSWLAALAQLGFQRNPYATHPRRSWVLDIRPDEETILAGMKEKWRYNIRLAGRKGVQVREATSPEDVDTFYRIYEETAKRDGIFIHGKQHYADFLRLYGARDAAVLLIAEYEGDADGRADRRALRPRDHLHVRRVIQPAPQPHAQPPAAMDGDPLGQGARLHALRLPRHRRGAGATARTCTASTPTSRDSAATRSSRSKPTTSHTPPRSTGSTAARSSSSATATAATTSKS